VGQCRQVIKSHRLMPPQHIMKTWLRRKASISVAACESFSSTSLSLHSFPKSPRNRGFGITDFLLATFPPPPSLPLRSEQLLPSPLPPSTSTPFRPHQRHVGVLATPAPPVRRHVPPTCSWPVCCTTRSVPTHVRIALDTASCAKLMHFWPTDCAQAQTFLHSISTRLGSMWLNAVPCAPSSAWVASHARTPVASARGCTCSPPLATAGRALAATPLKAPLMLRTPCQPAYAPHLQPPSDTLDPPLQPAPRTLS
jgi:hypothetical protein